MADFSPVIFAQAQTPAPSAPVAPGTTQPASPTAPSGGQAAAPNPLAMMVPIFIMFALLYFWKIRPENRRHRELQKQIDALKTGDKVITSGGIHGVIANVKEKTILLKIADNVKIEIQRASVQTVLKTESSPETPKEK